MRTRLSKEGSKRSEGRGPRSFKKEKNHDYAICFVIALEASAANRK
jgi:hypothetical protein